MERQGKPFIAFLFAFLVIVAVFVMPGSMGVQAVYEPYTPATQTAIIKPVNVTRTILMSTGTQIAGGLSPDMFRELASPDPDPKSTISHGKWTYIHTVTRPLTT